MTRHRVMIGRLLVAAAAAVGSLAFAAGASAGGWALTTLDAVPAPAPGEPTDVGFTIRQHGVTPVDLTEGVELVVTGPDGATTVFPAAGDGRLGHYVATIVVPTAGSSTWSVRQGWFGEQSLGVLVTAGRASGSGRGWHAPGPLVPVLVGLASVLGAAALADALRSRRRRPAGPTPGPAHGPVASPT